MAASYPTSVKVFTTKSTADVVQAAHVNDLQDEVNAIEAGLLNGTAPLNSSNSTVANLSVTGGSTLVSLALPSTGTIAIKDSSGTARVIMQKSTQGTPIFGYFQDRVFQSGSSYSLGVTNGLIFIRTTAGTYGLFMMAGSGTPTEVAESGTSYSNSSASTGMITLLANGRIENHTGSSATLSWVVMGMI